MALQAPDEIRKLFMPFFETVGSVVIGQHTLIERLTIALLTDGHVLIEGLPGLAKTLAARTVAKALKLEYRRIQFTPDLLPADVIGTQIYNPRTGEFSVKFGPVFANVVLADEINRAPAKVQSALLEAMQERRVTIGDQTYPLPKPFFVLATQNPIEQEGTYPLPEAQIDRFMMKVLIQYPNGDEELQVLDRMVGIRAETEVNPVLTASDLERAQAAVDTTHMEESIKKYIVDIVRATRTPAEYGVDIQGLLQCGASPRATLSLARAAKGRAFLEGRGYVVPDDVKLLAPDVLRHRILLSYEAEAEEIQPDTIVKRVLDGLPVP